MPSKRQRAQRNAARAASIQTFKKRRLEASSPLNSEQLNTDDDKLSTIDTTDDDGDSAGTWYWNESANETDSDSEEESCNNVDEEDLEEEQSKMEQAVSPKNTKVELKWNRKGEQTLRGGYGKGSRSTQMLHNKSAREFKKEASQTYNIQALWRRSKDLGMISQANSQVELEQPRESQPNAGVSFILPLFQVPHGCLPPLSKKQHSKLDRIEALKDLTRLLELVTEQEKKYEGRLSPHSNFYRRYLMAQQFLQTQLKSQPSHIRRDLSLNVSRAFGRGYPTARNIVQWEKSWVEKKRNPRKERKDGWGLLDV